MAGCTTPLHIAASQGDLKSLLQLLLEKDQTIINSRNERKETPLHLACAKGHVDVVKMLLKHGADIHIRDVNNNLSIHIAALYGHKDIICALINENCNPNVKGFKGRTALHFACIGGRREAANLLITKYKCPVDCRCSDKQTPLHYACRKGHLNVVRMLVTEHKADLTTRNCENNTPLHEAARLGHQDTVCALTNEFGCDPNEKGYNERTILHHASNGGHTDLMKMLISDFNVNKMAHDKGGNTPLHIAASAGQEKAINLLIAEYKCPVDCQNSINLTPLHCACIKGRLNVVRMLIRDHNADLTARSSDNCVPLHLAVYHGQLDTVCALIDEFSCKPNVKDHKHRNSLHYACMRGHLELMKVIISKDSDITREKDEDGNTPLHVAASAGLEEAAKLLISEYKCPVDCRNNSNETPLHCACIQGHIGCVKMLVIEYKADLMACSITPQTIAAYNDQLDTLCLLIKMSVNWNPNVKSFIGKLYYYACNEGHCDLIEMLISNFSDDLIAYTYGKHGNKLIHIAALAGQEEAVDLLITKGKCPVDCINGQNQTPLHLACHKGHLNVVRMLVTEHIADVTARNCENNTPLHEAARLGHQDTVCALTNEFGCDPNEKGYNERTILHHASNGGHTDLMKILISEFIVNKMARDKGGNTPLHIAASAGQEEAVNLLITTFKCPVDCQNSINLTPLHCACIKGRLNVVRTLLTDHNADLTACSSDNSVPLHVAVYHGQLDTVCALINEFHCDSSLRGFKDRTLLHYATIGGHLELVKLLISKYNNDPTVCDEDGNIPLHVAAITGQKEAANVLITKYKCPVDCRNANKETPLHCACHGGHPNVVEMLLTKHKADLTARSSDNDTPLHKAAFNGYKDIVCTLITKFKCDPSMKGFEGRTVLHQACASGHKELVETIVEQFERLIVTFDDMGNTPLHICSSFGKGVCIKFLLDCGAPVYIRNKSGKSAKDICAGHLQSIFVNYLKEPSSSLQEEYKKLQETSAQKFSGAQLITRVFVLGNPGGGKSTLVESFKRNLSFFDLKFLSSSAPPHTAGIVPSVCKSKQCGRLLFYDFAGDSEYYSSHAAILERVTMSSQGVSVYLLVVNVSNQEKQIKEELGYWLSFVAFHSKSIERKSIVQIVASHADREKSLKQKLNIIQEYSLLCEKQSQEVIEILPVISLDCRYPAQMKALSEIIQKQSLNFKEESSTLSLEATLLHGLLEKDFQNVTACKVQTLLTHVEETGVRLPKNVTQLYSILTKLHDVGLLLIIGRRGDQLENHSLILNPSALTNEVHKILFSGSSSKLNQYTTGIIPETSLQELPEHITTECLVQLQYCQELSHIDIFGVHESATSSDKYFYFPALCKQASPERLLPAELAYKIGWYAECKNKFEYFPPRFMHVLLLRLANTFALPPCGEHSNHYQRRCNMWTNGLRWIMRDGVTCSVEIVRATRGVVVFTGSSEEVAGKCTTILANIVRKILETKAEYCHSVDLQLYLVAIQVSGGHFNPEDRTRLFSIEEVDTAVRQGDRTVVCADDKGQQSLDHRMLCHIGKHTYWGNLFQFSFEDVLNCISKVVRKWFELGLALGLSEHCLNGIEVDHPNSVEKRKHVMIMKWMTLSQEALPCWCMLVKALRSIGLNVQAAEIERTYGVHIYLQEKLLDPNNATVKPDEEFLQRFAEVVGPHWPSIAALLSLTTSEIEEIKRHTQEFPSTQLQALHMLRIWNRRETATYGLLCERLKKITIFGY